ncbi:MAG: hypothetical protein SFY80_04130 [Verrucomicrobiota bacterium]|nr:hypothetical protein [Verrucomicrobiota bacterium]
MPYTTLPLAFTVGKTSQSTVLPETFVPATVPGAVQLDWARAHQWPDWNYGDNCKQYDGLEAFYWLYRTVLEYPTLAPGQKLYFVSQGIDYKFDIRLGGKVLLAQEGMFTPVELDLTGKAQPGDVLEILIHPAPDSGDRTTNRAPANKSAKPAVSWGWDWHPRLIPLGIWDDTRLEIRPAAHIKSAALDYILTDDLSAADIKLYVTLAEAPGGGMVEWVLDGPQGTMVIRQSAEAARQMVFTNVLPAPQLWWPHDHGPQNRYTVTVKLYSAGHQVLDERSWKTGFRRVRLVMHEGAWDRPGECPATQRECPFTVEINNRHVFAKGSNWVAPEIFPGLITAETYRPLLELAKEANFNLLRVWGGAMVSKDSFYEQCDALGLMVWQEFQQACNCHPDDAGYLKVLDQESRSIIQRVKPHPCRVLWCGGNELFNSWSRMTEQSHPLRLLNRNCYELDQYTPYIYTSPIFGVRHGDYRFANSDKTEVYQIFVRYEATAYTEFGVPGPSPVEILREIIPPAELFPPKPGTAWETHHAYKAWDGDAESWLLISTIERYFGVPASLEELVANGEWLQCEGYKCLFEESRRQKPRSSMALNWCYNEPWPSAANNSIVVWPARKKPAFEAVKAACRPVLASARIPKFTWSAGEVFTCQLALLNDSYAKGKPGEVRATLQLDEGTVITAASWKFAAPEPNHNLIGPEVQFQIPDAPFKTLTLRLSVPNRPELDSTYRLLAKRS